MCRVAIIGDNSNEYVRKLIEIWNAGDSAVLIDWRIPCQKAYDMMREANVQTCYIDQRLSDNWLFMKDQAIDIQFFENKVQGSELLERSTYTKFISNYSKNEALVIYSSGTTGKSKGVILSHYSINVNADAIQEYMSLSSNDCFYIAKSFSHSSTIVGELLVALKNCIPVVVAPTIVPPRYVLERIKRFSVTTIALNPSLIKMYAEEAGRKIYDLSSLKRIYVSGDLFDDGAYSISHELFGKIQIYNVYGLTEAGPRVSAQRINCCKSNSVGKPIKNVEVTIVDDSGNIVTTGNRGIIHVNTLSKYSGYVSGQEKNRSLYRDWINTGDVGYFDSDGELHIVGRIDDLIIIDGHKLYPNDIEQVIVREFGIVDCMVFKKHSDFGDYLGCLYVGNLDETSITRNLRKSLTSYEIPREFYRVTSIPTNINGKKRRSGF